MSETQEYLIFVVGAQQFAVPLLAIREIAETGEIQPLPNVASHVLGLANLRGEVLGVISLARRFGIKEVPSAFRAMMVFESEGSGLAVVVDQVLRVAEIPQEKIDHDVAKTGQTSTDWVESVGDFNGTIIPIIKTEHLLADASVATPVSHESA
jgi:purine-binding chemotaxis protein CheW